MSRWGGASWLDTILVTVWLSCLLIASSGGSRLFPITSALGSTGGNASDSSGTGSADLEAEVDEEARNSTALRCDDARLRCAYRTGCGRALQHYLSRCASVIHGDVNECPEVCQYALIALTSTDEGKELMTCDCAKDDSLCRQSKQRAEICRGSVTTTMNRTRVSCRVATWICNADALCSTALQYYNENCKRMFHGKKCTKRCRNSINILRRQDKAAKLNTCFCDGAEDYDCNAIHRNMDELCFNKPASQHHKYQEHEHGPSASGPGEPASVSAAGGSAAGFSPGDNRTNKLPTNRAPHPSTFWRILLLGLVLLLHSLSAKE